MSMEYDYLSTEEKEKIDELEDKVQHAEDDKALKRYTTQITLIYEKARVRHDTSRS
ncbi:hypothetical protein J2S78_001112 [Salibacterium salarium]|uniref:hypothetical protein n=1 Tax=Salibacterium salarium TaxID=284579 RepID=UPI00163A98BD|nr:hypothetical protein [Salibacterium salarium]MDQ0298704.1 hypothetical protein [Salibacterium salarium]